MRLKTMYPDYKHCILGIPNALLSHYGVKGKEYHLPKLEHALQHNHKNVVFMILDGMGIDMMQHQLGLFSFLRRHVTDKISSVFPPTTVAATTSYYSGLAPIETGWLGWAPYFKEVGCAVEMYTNKDYYMGTPISENVAARMPWQHIFDRIKAVNSAVQMTEIFPAKIKPDGAADFKEVCDRIVTQTQKEGEQFILVYWGDPDHTSHEFGPYSKEVGDVLRDLNQQIQKMCDELNDTLLIVSADHGHIDNNYEVMFDDYPDLVNCLAAPLCLDMRAQSVLLKDGKEEEFVNLFNKYLAKDFILIKSEDAVEKGLFGPGVPHPMAKDILCDYLIIAKTEKTLAQRIPNDVYVHLNGAHSGLTNREMLVPLILIKKD